VIKLSILRVAGPLSVDIDNKWKTLSRCFGHGFLTHDCFSLGTTDVVVACPGRDLSIVCFN
jgi:hypothetical protein